MNSPVRIHFPDSDESFIARRWKIPQRNSGTFQRLSPETTHIHVRQLFRNSQVNGGMRLRVPVQSARTWGLEDELEIVYARAETADGAQRFCLRFIFNADYATHDPMLETFRIYSNLLEDAKFHANHLPRAADVLVPRHFGMWFMETEQWAGMVLFSLTQWCGTSFSHLVGTKYDTLATRLAIGRTFEMLHDHGILYASQPHKDIMRHALVDIDPALDDSSNPLDPRTRCFVVSFSAAAAHHSCNRKMPVLPLGPYLRKTDYGCRELVMVTRSLGFFAPRADIEIRMPIEDVLRWHAAYMKRNGAAVPCNRHALVALRAKLFPQHASLYGRGFHINFSGDSEYPLVELVPRAKSLGAASSGVTTDKCNENISVRTSSSGSDSSEDI
ncbi:hypothetical protein MKEN_00599900 [Mycena kentingensis (nom. inval.)]|nr:hypothetical protein MKEN_00599900 [Mycena kentingensis (nom. inval.)]